METINKKNSKLSVFLALLVVAIFVGFLVLGTKPEREIEVESLSEADTYLYLAGETLEIEMTDNPASRERGFSGVTGIALDYGMLFIFNQPDQYSFWMKDMNFPLDIIWLDENFSVVHIERGILPETFPESFTSDTEALYVLEVFAGFVDRTSLKVGDVAELTEKN